MNWYLRQGLKYALGALPVPLRRPWVALIGRRVVEAEALSQAQVRDLQLRRLNTVLEWACRHVPFYRDHGAARTLPLRSLEDLRAWPVIDRRTVARERARFIARPPVPLPTRKGTTTGRSGVPLEVRWDWPLSLWWERAFQERAFRWAGLRPGFRRVVLRGGLVHGPAGPESRWWQHVPHEKALVLSTFQLSRATVASYVREMASFGPDALQAYPSAAAKLAALVEDEGLRLPPLKAVLTSSETLLPEDRSLIERVTGARVYDLYGHAERAVAAAQCARGSLHVFEDYGFLELLDEEGHPVEPPGVGEIVATGFHNRAMPLIRYRTGDQASLAEGACPCGLRFRVLACMEGRPPDYLVAGDGQRISLRFGLGGASIGGLDELRFYQIEPGVVEVRYVAAPDREVEGPLRDALTLRTGERIRYVFRRVDRLPPGPGGKAVLVVHGEATG